MALTFAGNALATPPNPQLAFTLPLNGDQVLPEVFSNMTGEARISFDPGMRFAKVVMQIKNNFSTVTGISLHLGEAGENGEVVVQVEDFSGDPITTRTFNVAEVISATEVNKVDTVVNIASLYQAVRDGRTYLLVTSSDYPTGEVRGQIFPAN